MNFFYMVSFERLHAYTLDMKRFICLLMSVLLLAGGCLPAKRVARVYLRISPGENVFHGQTPFGYMVLAYPNPDEIIDALDRAMEDASSARNEKDCEMVYEAQAKAYNELVSAASLVYVRYCQDVTNEGMAAEYTKLNSALYAIQLRLAKLEKAMMDQWGYHREKGSEYAENLDRFSQ